MKTIKLSPFNGNYYRLTTSRMSATFRQRLRDAVTIAGGTLGLCAFMFVLYLMVIMTSSLIQPYTG